MNKNIGIIGSGVVGQTLAAGFVKHGYSVKLGTRDVSKLAVWSSENEAIEITDVKSVAAFADILILAVKGSAAITVLKSIGSDILAGKIIIDTTNPIADLPPENGVIRFSTDLNQSLMEQLQTEFPQVNFVKSFNSIGSAFMVNPKFESKPTMFICGNDEKSKKTVSAILDKFGFETEDMGRVEAARAIEPLCILWCIPGFLRNQWSHAFRLMKG